MPRRSPDHSDNRKSFSPRELSRLLGVSESTVKRWCDDGRLAFTLSPGGHRRITGDIDELRSSLGNGAASEGVQSTRVPPVNRHGAPSASAASLVRHVIRSLDQDDIPSAVEVLAGVSAAEPSDADGMPRIFCMLADQLYLEPGGGDLRDSFSYHRPCRNRSAVRVLQAFLSRVIRQEDSQPSAVIAGFDGVITSATLYLAAAIAASGGFRATVIGKDLPFPSLAESLQSSPKVLILLLDELRDPEEFARCWAGLAEAARNSRTRLILLTGPGNAGRLPELGETEVLTRFESLCPALHRMPDAAVRD